MRLKKRKLNDKWILGEKPYSNNPKDDYLRIVLCYLPTNKMTPYVTWIYNESDNAFYEGNYFERIYKAIGDYLIRGSGTAKYTPEMIKSYDAIEIHYCQILNHPSNYKWELEECGADNAQIVSVYLHCPSGGIEWISDHLNGPDAHRIARWISRTYELPIKMIPEDIEYVKLKSITK